MSSLLEGIVRHIAAPDQTGYHGDGESMNALADTVWYWFAPGPKSPANAACPDARANRQP